MSASCQWVSWLTIFRFEIKAIPHHTSDQSPTRAPFAYSFCVSFSRPVFLLGPDDSGQIFQIITGRWEMRSLTERRWLDMPRKIWVLCYTPHERCTCDRIFCKKVKNRNSYLRSIFEEKILIYPTCIFLTYQDEVNSVMGNMTGSLYTPAPVLHWWQKIVLSMGY